jgi:peptide/nickel transport system permease protein
LIVGFTAVFISGAIGIVLGLTAGYFGGIVDDIIMRIADITLAFPFILLAIAVMAVLGPGLFNIILVLGITGWVTYGRVVRAEVLSYREKEFVEAAVALGYSSPRIIFKHIFPNVVSAIIVIASFSIASTIISEASLSFLGLGVQPSIPSWGAMISDAREYIYKAWWLAVFPGVAIVLTVLGINIFGDWLRDYLDPGIQNF